MDFKSLRDFLESTLGKEFWIFQLLFCSIVPSFLFIFYLANDFFKNTETIKLMILCIIFNIFLIIILFAYEIIMDRNDKPKITQSNYILKMEEAGKEIDLQKRKVAIERVLDSAIKEYEYIQKCEKLEILPTIFNKLLSISIGVFFAIIFEFIFRSFQVNKAYYISIITIIITIFILDLFKRNDKKRREKKEI